MKEGGVGGGKLYLPIVMYQYHFLATDPINTDTF